MSKLEHLRGECVSLEELSEAWGFTKAMKEANTELEQTLKTVELNRKLREAFYSDEKPEPDPQY